MSEPVDLLIRGTLVNVHTGTLEGGAVAVDDGEIVALEERPAERELEAAYVAPGLIDAHMHVESSMVPLVRYAEAVVPRGVVGLIWDPHEIANVLGESGIRSAIADVGKTPLKARITVPSSVPASGLQQGGATVGPDAVDRLLDANAVVALGEVMDVPAVVAGEETVHEKIAAARERGLTVDGHMPRVTGSTLQEAARFLDTDHESISLEEARAKAAAGIRVYLREGSSSTDLATIAPLVEEIDTRFLSLCTDDRDILDLVDRGGIDDVLRRAIAEGIDPVTAVQMATLNTAESYGLPFGRLQPGAPADLVLLSDLETWAVDHVLVDGVVDPTGGSVGAAQWRGPEETRSGGAGDEETRSGEAGERRSAEPSGETPVTALSTDTVACGSISPSDLAHPAPTDADTVTVRVIDSVEGIQTARKTATVPVRDGVLVANREADAIPLAVIDRHRPDGPIGTGFVHGLGLDRGAIATTVAHDAHNLVVAGRTHDAMATVATELCELGGGIAVFDPESEEITALSLPIAGLLSDQPLTVVCDQFEAVDSAATQIGLTDETLLGLTFLSLEVIPELRLTSNGLVDVDRMTYVDVVV